MPSINRRNDCNNQKRLLLFKMKNVILWKNRLSQSKVLTQFSTGTGVEIF